MGGWMDGQTDKTKVTVAFRNFANSPKNPAFRPQASSCFVRLSNQTQHSLIHHHSLHHVHEGLDVFPVIFLKMKLVPPSLPRIP